MSIKITIRRKYVELKNLPLFTEILYKGNRKCGFYVLEVFEHGGSMFTVVEYDSMQFDEKYYQDVVDESYINEFLDK